MVQDWLPANAWQAVTFKEAVKSRISLWAERWFGSASMDVRLNQSKVAIPVQSAENPKKPVAPPPGEWKSFGTGCAIFLSDAAGSKLGCAALGVTPKKPLSKSDTAVLNKFGEEIIVDLLKALSGRQDTPLPVPATEGKDSVEILFDVVRVPLRLKMPRSVWVDIYRQALSKKTRPAHGLWTLRDAIQGNVVTVSADLGTGSLSAAQLRALEVGDVIVLENEIGTSATLRISETGRALATADFDIGGRDKVSLTITDVVQAESGLA